MKLLPFVAKEGLVLLVGHVQRIKAHNLHEDWVDDVIQPVNNELDAALSCHTQIRSNVVFCNCFMSRYMLRQTAAKRARAFASQVLEGMSNCRHVQRDQPSWLPKKEGASRYVLSRYSAIRHESTMVVSPSISTGTCREISRLAVEEYCEWCQHIECAEAILPAVGR